MCFKPLLLLWVFSCLTAGLKAQEDPDVKAVTSALADALPEGEDLSDLTERLSYYKKHKIELNTARPEQLKELIFLSPLQINNLLIHIKATGKLLDLAELQVVDGFDIATTEKLLPFVTLKPATVYGQLSWKKIWQEGNGEVLWRYAQIPKKQKGYSNLPGSRYLGPPQKLLIKYRYKLGETAALSFVMEKDAGEPFFNQSAKYGFDFISGNITFYNAGKFSHIIIGDYSLQFGQGLTTWSGLSFGKGADVAGITKKDTGLKPYTSTGEYAFFRGIAGTVKLFNGIDLTSFVSSRSLDASLTENGQGGYTLVTVNESGLHRTATEAANKGDLKLIFYGLAFRYNTNSLGLGLVTAHSVYQHTFVTGTQLYNSYGFAGTGLTNLGIHYNYTWRNSYVFGETARSLPGGLALLNGILISLSPKVSAVVLYRNYAKGYTSFYSQGIGEGTEAMNEKGIYSGINLYPAPKWTLSVYMDAFRFPWLKYRTDAGSSGNDIMGQLIYAPSKSFKAQLRYKTKTTAQNASPGTYFNTPVQVRTENYRLEVNWIKNRSFSFQNRAEVSRYKKETMAEWGFLLYQDADYNPLPSRLAVNLRLAWFHTPSYNSRIYAYEDDVLYGSGSGLYNGDGLRFYMNLKYRLSRKVDIWTRYSVSYYPGEPSIGSGPEEITGSKKPEIKVQLRYQF
jgi:hypothetical protein